MTDTPTKLRDGRFTIVRVLGEGSQASTFEAVDEPRQKRVAVKRFRVRGAKSWKEVELAEREARVLSSLSHPRIPRYIDHFEEGGELFLVTEMIEGTSLAEVRKSGASLGEGEVIRFLRDASSALDYLHGRAPPIIHRDIKPSNVILRADGTFSLIDFGAVRDRMKPGGGSTVVGTFGFMAPEQFQGRAVPGSDVYAVGVTAITVLTGREPEDLPHRGLAIDVEAALRGTRASRALINTLAAMVEPDPDRRPARIAPLLADLERGRGDADASGRASRSGPASAGSHGGSGGRDHRAKQERKRAEREAERERRHAAREAERERRWARRHASRVGYSAARGIPSFVAFLMVFGLSFAEVAVLLTLRGAVPLLLSVLSLIFGRGLLDAARRVREAGAAAATAIGRARRFVQPGKSDPSIGVRFNPEADEARVRVADPASADAEAERAAEAEVDAEEAAKTQARGR